MAAATTTRDKIVEKAKELAIKYRDSAYKMGGKDTSAFDCSYFVYLVMKEIFEDFEYAASSLIADSPKFKKGTGQPGDIIFFPAGQVPYEVKKGNTRTYPNHVGIIIDNNSWVGRQSSSLGVVPFSNPWWGSREYKTFTYHKIDAAAARLNGASLREHFA